MVPGFWKWTQRAAAGIALLDFATNKVASALEAGVIPSWLVSVTGYVWPVGFVVLVIALWRLSESAVRREAAAAAREKSAQDTTAQAAVDAAASVGSAEARANERLARARADIVRQIVEKGRDIGLDITADGLTGIVTQVRPIPGFGVSTPAQQKRVERPPVPSRAILKR